MSDHSSCVDFITAIVTYHWHDVRYMLCWFFMSATSQWRYDGSVSDHSSDVDFTTVIVAYHWHDVCGMLCLFFMSGTSLWRYDGSISGHGSWMFYPHGDVDFITVILTYHWHGVCGIPCLFLMLATSLWWCVRSIMLLVMDVQSLTYFFMKQSCNISHYKVMKIMKVKFNKCIVNPILINS